MLAADKVLIVGDFNIYVDNEKDALGLAFLDISCAAVLWMFCPSGL